MSYFRKSDPGYLRQSNAEQDTADSGYGGICLVDDDYTEPRHSRHWRVQPDFVLPVQEGDVSSHGSEVLPHGTALIKHATGNSAQSETIHDLEKQLLVERAKSQHVQVLHQTESELWESKTAQITAEKKAEHQREMHEKEIELLEAKSSQEAAEKEAEHQREMHEKEIELLEAKSSQAAAEKKAEHQREMYEKEIELLEAKNSQEAAEKEAKHQREMLALMQNHGSNRYEDPELDCYEILKKLGKGGGGTVFLVKNSIDHKQHALKMIKLPTDTKEHEYCLREAKRLASMDHSNVLRHHHSLISQTPIDFMKHKFWNSLLCKSGTSGSLVCDLQSTPRPTYLFIFTEYCPEGSLEGWLGRQQEWKSDIAMTIFDQILEGVCNIHKKLKCAHGDLETRNILVYSDNPLSIRVADLGLADYRSLACSQGASEGDDMISPSKLQSSIRRLLTKRTDETSLAFMLSSLLHPVKEETELRRNLLDNSTFPRGFEETHSSDACWVIKQLLADKGVSVVELPLRPEYQSLKKHMTSKKYPIKLQD